MTSQPATSAKGALAGPGGSHGWRRRNLEGRAPASRRLPVAKAPQSGIARLHNLPRLPPPGLRVVQRRQPLILLLFPQRTSGVVPAHTVPQTLRWHPIICSCAPIHLQRLRADEGSPPIEEAHRAKCLSLTDEVDEGIFEGLRSSLLPGTVSEIQAETRSMDIGGQLIPCHVVRQVQEAKAAAATGWKGLLVCRACAMPAWSADGNATEAART